MQNLTPTVPGTVGAGRMWLPRAAPMSLFVGGTALALALVALATLWVLQQPWLGLRLQPDEGGLRIVEVDPRGPAAGRLEPGRVISALAAADREPLSLQGFQPGLEPHSLSSFEAYDAYLDEVEAVWSYARQGSLRLILDTGERVSLLPAEQRPLTSLPVAYWFFHLFGLIALLISLAVWVFRRGQAATRLFVLAGLGFFLATWSNSLYLPRELAYDPVLLSRLGSFNHAAMYLMMASLLGLLMYFPRRLITSAMGVALLALVLALQVNEQLSLAGWPLHDFYFPVIFLYLIGAAIATWQWRAARGRPLDRAALRWLFLSVFISTGMGLMVYFLPSLYREPKLFSQVAMVGFASTMYLGLALGILRYRLFDLERWWFGVWLWFFGGVAVLVVDASVVFLFGMQPIAALGIAVLLVGWVYFPIRQWLWGNYAAAGQPRLEAYLPALIGPLLAARGPDDVARQWHRVLTGVFNPLNSRQVPPLERPALAEQGAALRVPVPGAKYGLELVYGQRGGRLFGCRDLELVSAMLAVTVQAVQVHGARKAGAQEERRRIMRDLHDDVGARILSLIHGATEPRQEALARAALHALRESIYALDEDMRVNLCDAAQEWRLEVKERVQDLPLQLGWRAAALPAELSLTARQSINLKRILQEAISNALSHSRPRRLEVSLGVEGDRLRLEVSNDGLAEPAREGDLPGRGLHNMRTRAAELAGELETGRSEVGYRVRLSVPLPQTESEHA